MAKAKKRGVYDPEIIPNPNLIGIPKSKVIAQFVDALPLSPQFRPENLTRFAPQEGAKEAMELAFQNKGRAMLFVRYDVGSRSERKGNARIRAKGLIAQGYSPENGWTIRAVDAEVYVLYHGEEDLPY